MLGREGTNSVPGGLSSGSLCCRCLFGCNMDTNEKGRWRKRVPVKDFSETQVTASVGGHRASGRGGCKVPACGMKIESRGSHTGHRMAGETLVP